MSDEDIENTLREMVKQGLVREIEQNGEILYQITPKGEAAIHDMKQQLN